MYCTKFYIYAVLNKKKADYKQVMQQLELFVMYNFMDERLTKLQRTK